MIELADEYVGASCVIKAKNNDLLSMGTLHRIKESYIDISNARNELPEIPYNMLVKIEIYNSRLGFRVLIGRVYISSAKMARIIDLNEASGDEKREYFRINIMENAEVYYKREIAKELEVELVDISLGGLLFKTREEFHVDELLSIRIPAIHRAEPFPCIIRRNVEFQYGFRGYGCEFLSLSRIQEDLLYKYMLKKQNDQLKRVR